MRGWSGGAEARCAAPCLCLCVSVPIALGPLPSILSPLARSRVRALPPWHAPELRDAVRRWTLLLAQNTQPSMGLFSLNGTFLQIFIPVNAAFCAAPVLIKLFIDKFELSMLPFELAAADAPFVTMTAYMPLVMITNLATVFYVLLGEGGAYNNSDSRGQKATFTGLKARVSIPSRWVFY